MCRCEKVVMTSYAWHVASFKAWNFCVQILIDNPHVEGNEEWDEKEKRKKNTNEKFDDLSQRVVNKEKEELSLKKSQSNYYIILVQYYRSCRNSPTAFELLSYISNPSKIFNITNFLNNHWKTQNWNFRFINSLKTY